MSTSEHPEPAPHEPRQLQHRLKPDEIDQLVEARKAGATIKELAAKFEIHRTTVMEHLKRRSQPSTQLSPSEC